MGATETVKCPCHASFFGSILKIEEESEELVRKSLNFIWKFSQHCVSRCLAWNEGFSAIFFHQGDKRALSAYPKVQILEGALLQRRALQNLDFRFSDRH